MTNEFPESFSQTFQVRYDECGADGAVRAAVHLRWFQEIAFGHSAVLGFPLSWYEAHRLFWVVRRVHLVVHAPARYGETLVCTTRVAGARRVMSRRASEARRTGGALVAACVTDWVFTADGAAAVRIADELATAFPAMRRAVAPLPLEEPPAPGGPRASVRPRLSDLDAMGHVNHPAYVDLLDDAVARAGGGQVVAAHPRTYDLLHHAAAAAHDDLRDLAWPADGAWHYRLERADGRLLLHGRLAAGERPAGRAAPEMEQER
ncbi:MAG: acyl-[acyl-carrier-protein] thioesterase [Armatimonadota bacterium]|nr:acyl-[acyl-carrier-protein] thioesterase [Armatimonadota bacterium]